MRKSFILSVLIICGLWATTPAKASSICDSTSGNIVTNCGFESGSFSGWSVTGNLYGGVGGNYIGVDNSNPNSGNFEAYFGAPSTFGQTGSGDKYGPATTLSQTLAVLPNQYYEVSFYLDSDGCSVTDGCPGEHNYFDAYFNGVLLAQQFDQPFTGSYEEYVYVEPTANSGNTGVLQFDFTNDDDYFFLDDVSVSSLGPVPQTPEPTTMLLFAGALGQICWMRRKRKATTTTV
jgi:hypothetical protein